MNRFIAQRRRAQGMTEYLVLLGLIALLLIAAVRHFARAVDEAIEGTVLAWETHEDPSDAEHQGKSRKVGETPEGVEVWLASVKDGAGGWKWERQSPKGVGPYTGRVLSGRLGSVEDD